jgi:hypothetical protein
MAFKKSIICASASSFVIAVHDKYASSVFTRLDLEQADHRFFVIPIVTY